MSQLLSDLHSWLLGLTYLGHDDRGGHAPPLSAVGQDRGVAGGGEELAIAEAEEVELVDDVVQLSAGDWRLSEEGLGELQGSLHHGALQGTQIPCWSLGSKALQRESRSGVCK